jgi:hypothetical protein
MLSSAAPHAARVARELAQDAVDLRANRSNSVSQVDREQGEQLLVSAALAAERVAALLLSEKDREPTHP